MTLTKKGFTLIELLVVVAMVAVITGAMTTSMAAAQNRARIQKATSEVKVVSQAILSYEDYANAHDLTIPTMTDADADEGSLGFIIGKAGSEKVPALLMAALQGGGKMRDPWGTPYKISIKKGKAMLKLSVAGQNMRMNYFLPNIYRIGEGERSR